ncbi:hypothetical protein E2C01_065171 [Portunus trituberculatus]|uniref:Uncharacterized protein n=1 Tax=Portunus trituberculatus TaxID=210409 RepID=A0A5B7HMA7_PORTR|nr:hypothetical protein [Portunus trituberculatus]
MNLPLSHGTGKAEVVSGQVRSGEGR